MAGKGGGAWKVAYADFVTAMMAFFLVMWITAQSNAIKQSVAKYFEHPYDAMSRSPVPASGTSGASLVPLHRELDGSPPHTSNKGKSAFGGGMLTDNQPPADPATVPKSGGLRRRSGFMLRDDDPSGMGNVILFSHDAVELDDRGKQSLNELVPVFNGKLNMIEIRGSAATPQSAQSSVTAASKSDNTSLPDPWKLSYDRCLAVMNYLESRGIQASRIRLSQNGIAKPPKTDSDDHDGQGHDAKVEVYMLSEYADEYLEYPTQADDKRLLPPPEIDERSKPDSSNMPSKSSAPAAPQATSQQLPNGSA